MTRLQKEYRALLKEPVPQIAAHPAPNNLLEWHYALDFPSGDGTTPYEGGVYHGKVVFPPQYPFKPPSILMFTPSGRFAVNTRLCLRCVCGAGGGGLPPPWDRPGGPSWGGDGSVALPIGKRCTHALPLLFRDVAVPAALPPHPPCPPSPPGRRLRLPHGGDARQPGAARAVPKVCAAAGGAVRCAAPAASNSLCCCRCCCRC